MYDDAFAEVSLQANSLADLQPLKRRVPSDNSAAERFPHSPRRAFSSLTSRAFRQHLAPLAPVPKLVHDKNPANWHMHIILLPHNAIRAEIHDLSSMVHAVTQSHTTVLREWHTVFDKFVEEFLQFEEQVLLPWTYAGATEIQASFRKSLAEERAMVRDALTELRTTIRLLRTRPMGHVKPLLIRASREMGDVIEAYFLREERVLPDVIRGKRSREQGMNVERVMARRMDVGLLVRWIPSRERGHLRRRLVGGRFWEWVGGCGKHLGAVDTVLAARL